MKTKKPELVCPAGDWPSLVSAAAAGADSVYFGVKDLNLRNLAVNFDILEIKKVMRFLHERKLKGYLALNGLIMNSELDKLARLLTEAKRCGADAVVVWDMAAFSLARELGLAVHLSTQASVANRRALSFFAELGASRVILARECALPDIKEITTHLKEHGKACVIEAFVHGAMCLSISGRCFLSQYSFGKSANRGECWQPCRRRYQIRDCDQEADYLLDQHDLLSPKDLCTIDFIDELIRSGIGAFKIEGRKRSAEYVQVVTSAYRRAIDSFFSGTLTPALKASLKQEVARVYNRGFSPGFYFGRPQRWGSRGLEHSYEKVFLGEVTNFYKKIKVAEVFLRQGPLRRGESLLFIGKNTPACFARAESLEQNHLAQEEVSRGERVGVKLPFIVRRKDKVFIWRKRAL